MTIYLRKVLIVTIVLLGIWVMFPALLSATHNCDFAAVLTKEGYIVPDNFWGQTVWDNPRTYYFDFVTSRSSYDTNDDGYGVIYSKEGETYIPRNTQTWYSTCPYYSYIPNLLCYVPFNQADRAIMTTMNEAVMVMVHARNGSGGLPGNHPFTLEPIWAMYPLTYSFMHNGYIKSTGNVNNIKQALWNELYNYYGNGNGQWFQEHPSNWLTFAQTANYANFIDSELLFHWIAKNIQDHNGSVIDGLRSALTANVRCPAGSVYRSINLCNQFRNNIAENKINFVFSDCESLYVFRNTPIDGNAYNISYHETYGFTGVKTQATVGTSVGQFELVVITRDAAPVVHRSFINFFSTSGSASNSELTEEPISRECYADLSITMTDSPDPVWEGNDLTFTITVSNNGPATVYAFLSDPLPSNVIENPTYHYTGSSRVAPWTGSLSLGQFPPYTSKQIIITGEADPTIFIRYFTNRATVSYLSTSQCVDPNPANNVAETTTEIRWWLY